MDFNRRVLPFFMTYPGFGPDAGRDAMRDLEYLQQMYPREVKRYQMRISEMLDKMDYDGSMIYDEYPDRTAGEFHAGCYQTGGDAREPAERVFPGKMGGASGADLCTVE